jgi:surface protein
MTVFDGAYAFNSDLSKWQTDKVSDMAFMFSAASAFNVDLSKWKVDKLTATKMTDMFKNAKAFNQKTTLDIAWEASNPSVYPGTNMFTGTCSEDLNCGKCSKKNTDSNSAVTCSSETQPAKDSSTACIFCLNDAYECCTRKLPNGNGEFEVAKRTGNTLNRIVDDWLDANKRPAIEAIYGSIGDWDVSAVTNFAYLFWHKRTFIADISKWNVSAAESLQSMFANGGDTKGIFNGDLSEWQTSRVVTLEAST